MANSNPRREPDTILILIPVNVDDTFLTTVEACWPSHGECRG